MTKIVILGLGAAGFAAALAIKKQDRTAQITIIDKKDYDLMHPCGLPYALEGKIQTKDLKHSIGADKMKIILKSNEEAIKLDIKGKVVLTTEGDNIPYDKLILCMGASSFIPPVEGKEFCLTVDTPENVTEIAKRIKTSKTATVIGAGAIGVETAWALKERGLDVTIVDMLQSTFPKTIDKDISQILEDYLRENGITLKLGRKLDKIESNSIIVDGEKIPSDLTIAATGVRANTKLASESGIKCGNFGIIVNESMQTNVKDIYSVGDCTEIVNAINKKPYVCQIASAAFKQGTIAGTNAAGGKETYPGALGTFVSVIGKIEIAATGFNEHFAKENGFDIAKTKAKGKTLPEWMPDGENITIKILVDKKTKKVIGAQAIGKGAAERINIVSTAIKAGFTLKQLAEVELAYCPAVSQVQDVLTLAAELGLRRL